MRLLSRFGAGLAMAGLLMFSAAASGAELEKITIGLSSSSLPIAPARIAKELGLFERQGLEPNFTVMESANAADAALIAGSVNVVVTGPTDVVIGQARGQKLVTIASAYSGFSAVLVLSKATVDKLGVSPNAPVAERLKALDGLVIGSPSATSTYTFAVKPSAAAAGAKVNMTYLAQPGMLAALESGAIAGFIASAPFYTQPVLRGSGVIWISGPKGEFPPQFSPANAVTVNTRLDFAQSNPALIKRITVAMADFAKAVDERPNAVKSAIAKLFPNMDAQTLDLFFATESGSFKTKPITPQDMAREINFVKTSGVDLPQLDKLDPASLIFP
jgi:ABC-type nitrate/sulfonate/bicarbonate transport system substrate-binding protein